MIYPPVTLLRAAGGPPNGHCGIHRAKNSGVSSLAERCRQVANGQWGLSNEGRVIISLQHSEYVTDLRQAAVISREENQPREPSRRPSVI
jgi:hypothetical protein